MSRFTDWVMGRPRQEARTITDLPWNDSGYRTFNYGDPDLGQLTQQRALTLGPVYSSNRILAQSISTLPLKTFRRDGETRQPMSKLPPLFDLMVTDGTLVPWLHQCVTSLGLRGNAYGFISARDGFGYPTSIQWLDPAEVMADDDRVGFGHAWLWRGRQVAAENIVHIPWFTIAGRRTGLSPLRAFASTLGVGLQSQQYGSDWFGGGGFPPGTFKNEEKIVGQEEADAIKARLVSAVRTRTPLVYGKDWTFSPISVPPEEAQFVQTQKMTATQIAAIYGVPANMVGGENGSSMTYANVEQESTNFVMFTLRPWLVLLESAFSAYLPNRQYVKFNADALIRADLQTRWQVNAIRVGMGESNIDEIRAQEDKPPLPDGQGQKYGPPALSAPPSTQDNPNQDATGNVVPMRRDAHE